MSSKSSRFGLREKPQMTSLAKVLTHISCPGQQEGSQLKDMDRGFLNYWCIFSVTNTFILYCSSVS